MVAPGKMKFPLIGHYSIEVYNTCLGAYIRSEEQGNSPGQGKKEMHLSRGTRYLRRVLKYMWSSLCFIWRLTPQDRWNSHQDRCKGFMVHLEGRLTPQDR